MMGVGVKRALGLYRSCAPRHIYDGNPPIQDLEELDLLEEEQLLEEEKSEGNIQ